MLAVGLAAGGRLPPMSGWAGGAIDRCLPWWAAVPWVACYYFRKKGPGAPSARADRNVNLDVGETVSIDQWNADGTASVKYRGAQWTAIHRPGRCRAPARTAWPNWWAVGCWSIRSDASVGTHHPPALYPCRRSLPHSRRLVMEVAIVHLRHRGDLHCALGQGRAATERLGQRAPGQIRRHPDTGAEFSGAFCGPRGLQAQPERNSARCAQPDLHHAATTRSCRSMASCTFRSPTRCAPATAHRNYIMAVTQLAQTTLR